MTLAERWNGSSWAVKSTPNPSGATGSSLSGLACASTTQCTAVGDYFNSSGVQFMLAERWNGSSWAVQPTPNPSGATGSSLSAVACASTTVCTAVGYYGNSSGADVTLAERWNGSSWAVQSTPNPSGATGSSLSGVACASTAVCTAVGSSSSGTLAERWNGSGWAVQSTPNPSGGPDSFLSGVACASTTVCTAVGSSDNSSRVLLTLAERWNGSSWAVQSTPNPSGGGGIGLFGVACASATLCTAVGDYLNSSTGQLTLAERWNGSSWAVQSTPNPPGAPIFSSLSGVACASTTQCTAVGSWTNIQCGCFSFKGGAPPLAERWNGSSWTVQSTPKPSGATVSFLSGVACASTTLCTAVGSYDNSSGVTLTLAERWNGSSWAVQSTPNPSGATSSNLSGVACASTTACTAVGSYSNSSGVSLTLAERWNGSSWAVQSTPNPSGGGSLSGVACASTTVCTAVGSSSSQFTLAERWNGSSWAIQSTPNPSGAAGSSLSGVACASTTLCTAVGFYVNSSFVTFTLAERYS